MSSFGYMYSSGRQNPMRSCIGEALVDSTESYKIWKATKNRVTSKESKEGTPQV